MRKCPYCNNPLDSGFSSLQLLQLMRKRPKELQKTLKKLFNKISDSIPSEQNRWRATNFMNAIRFIDNRKVTRSVDKYLNDQLYTQMKGYPYLTKMVVNMGMNFEAELKFERKRIGTTPRIVDPKEYL